MFYSKKPVPRVLRRQAGGAGAYACEKLLLVLNGEWRREPGRTATEQYKGKESVG